MKFDNGRTAIVDELGRNIPDVPIDDFIRDYLPPPHVDVSRILAKLKTDKHVRVQGSWSSFPDPAKSKKSEIHAFKPFKRSWT
jgi:hypothetical protein